MSDTTYLLSQVIAELKSIRRLLRTISTRLETVWTWGTRGALLVGWWGAAIYLNASAEEKAAMLALALKGLTGP
jgi:hypothetical protein